MVPEQLEPRLDLLREEYVLVQAWKKAATYIRYHNWFSDTLELDHATVNLPLFIGTIRERLQSSDAWQNDPLRLVPAPKSQRWHVQKGSWKPTPKPGPLAPLRPLAHVSLADQVIATAFMLCLANRVETQQGDPRLAVDDQESRKRVISYGNRLFCDKVGKQLQHRWGSAKLYRAYHQDYRKFLSRPRVAAEEMPATVGGCLYVIHADLAQFYDRIRPSFLAKALDRIRQDGDDTAFYSLAASVLNWSWHVHDKTDVGRYAKQVDIPDFTQIALPQGLVASGFFANVVLLPLDDVLRAAVGTEISPGILLADACRYVDDLRILVSVDRNPDISLTELKGELTRWLDATLGEKTCGLKLSRDKTEIATLGGDERPIVRQSAKMDRIQSAVSGGFDAFGGLEILDAIQGLMRTQEVLSGQNDDGWSFSPLPDVRDETVDRFSADRYRRTFRSIRPLLDDDPPDEVKQHIDDTSPDKRMRLARTRREWDENAQVFALSLVKRWADDPSNVRLLRIGLDIWPDVKLLHEVLSRLRPFTEKGGQRGAPRRVAWYCLAEVLRAGATETGLVEDAETLPSKVDLDAYRMELHDEAVRLLNLPGQTIPWYLRQQALLFLAACDPRQAPVKWTRAGPETRHYEDMIQFLRGEGSRLTRSSDFSTLAVLARRTFVGREQAVALTRPGLDLSKMRQLARHDPSFLLELLEDKVSLSLLAEDLPPWLREDLCLTAELPHGDYDVLDKAVLRTSPDNPLRNELSLLRFAKVFLEQWEKLGHPVPVITPGQVALKLSEDHGVAEVAGVEISENQADMSTSMYEVPTWCSDSERWRFQLGFLLRFVLSRHPDFTRPVRRSNWKEARSAYRPAESHWYQRLYGLYSGQQAFGDDWLPITDWFEGFLLALLRWPGCRVPSEFDWIKQGIKQAKLQIDERIAHLEDRRGAATCALILPLRSRGPTDENVKRPLRACVVQTVVPNDQHFKKCDLALDGSAIRRKHRNHLSAALAAVERMLRLRETHKGRDERLDWLILPELAVHPSDVRTHLVPFARSHKAIILAGLTYEEVLRGQPLVNSALWVIPEWSDDRGLQIKTRRQGKMHLAQDEKELNACGTELLRGFRPCQWLIGYQWSNKDEPIWLTGVVCYDATDIGLAADLRNESDILAIPALNKDIKTFDQMALALHYHMFQLVIVANNGKYGGSNAYWPKTGHAKQVFHTHGQPQAAVSFLEIDDIGAFLARHDGSGANATDWKHLPAGGPKSTRGSP